MKKIILLLVLIGSFNAFAQNGEFEVKVKGCSERSYLNGLYEVKEELGRRKEFSNCHPNSLEFLNYSAISFKENGFGLLSCINLTVKTTFFCDRSSW